MILPWLKLRYLRLMQDRLIFKPIHKQIFPTGKPTDYNLPNTMDVTLTTSDNVKIHLWHHRTKTENAPTFVFFHGNTGSWVDVGKPLPHEDYDRAYRLNLLQTTIAQNANFIAVSMRGYGNSERYQPSEKAFEHDIEAVSQYIIRDANIAPNKLIILGESLGAAVALMMAEYLTKTDTPPHLVCTIAAFSSMANRVFDDHPDLSAEQIEHHLRHDFNSLNRTNALSPDTALLIFHGNEDDKTGFYHSEILYAAATSKELATHLETIDGAGHIDWDAEFVIKKTLDYYDKL